MECPVCGDKLRPIEKYGVEIDVCPGCKGVWLDRGELEKILAADSDSSDRGDRPTSDQYRDEKPRDDDRDRRDDRSKPKKRSSLLGDILGGFGGGGD
jgi:Zn-finger nucleic acid-binding protein